MYSENKSKVYSRNFKTLMPLFIGLEKFPHDNYNLKPGSYSSS